jgi:hypothetical protein
MATALLVTVVVAVVGVGTGGLLRRKLADERTSVRDYQQALDTLRYMSARRAEAEGAAPRPVANRYGIGAVSPEAARPAGRGRPASASRNGNGGASRNGAGAAARNGAGAAARNGTGAAARNGGRSRSRSTASASAARRTEVLASSRGGRGGSGHDRAAAFRSGGAAVSMRVDAADVELGHAPAPAEGSSAPVTEAQRNGATAEVPVGRNPADAVRELAAARALHGPRPARPSMPSRHRTGPSRTTVLTVAAVVVIASVTGVAVALGPSRHASSASSAAHGVVPPTSVVRHVASRPAKPKTARAGGSSSSSTLLTPVTVSGSAATYQVGSSAFTLTLAADGACWVEAKDPSSGQVLWSGTLQSGQTQQVPASGQLVVRLGDAHNVTVTVAGRHVVLPTGFDSVVDLTFEDA